MPKVSIVIPVYNVEEYIDKCLDSLVNQTMKDIEIIVVNDASPDNSQDIIDKYVKKYPKMVKSIIKKNGGVSDARNFGLKEATGEYIGFVDPDDWVTLDMYEKLYNKAKKDKCDLVACDANAVYPDRDILIESGIHDDTTVKDALVGGYAVIWNKIYSRELIKGIDFKIGSIFEDVLFLFKVYPKVKKFGSINEPMYSYLQRSGSYTYTYNDKLYQAIEINDDIVAYYKENKYFDEYKEEIEYTYVRYLYATFIKRLAKTKNFIELKRGTKYVLEKVKNQFPKYKKNKYLKVGGFKNFYIKMFCRPVAYIGYFFEKNKMN